MLEEQNDNLHMADGTNLDQQKDTIVEAINSTNAEDGEDTSITESVSIPLLNYEELSLEDLNKELEQLLHNHKIMAIREHAEAIKKAFYHQYNELIEEKRTAFLEENPDAFAHDFQYELPVKNHFEANFNEYRNKRSTHYKLIQEQLKKNLSNRNQIINELKEIVNNTENFNAALKDIHHLRDRWKAIGPIPKDNYNHVWNNYHFYLERFYDQLHLDREARDLDLKLNLESKQKVIERASELLNEPDIRKAFRELQSLHRVWKEEIGPVPQDVRETIWENFSNITKQLHDKREALQGELRKVEEDNLVLKNEILASIKKLTDKDAILHNDWQKSIKEFELLRKNYLNIGRIPSEKIEESWAAFKDVTRNFNYLKNNFYKDIKKEQHENFIKKQALIEQAQSLNQSTDFQTTTPIMKKIQEDWKAIGHVPRKISEKLWKDFREACNIYFDRLHSERNKEIESEMLNFDKKKAYLEDLKTFELKGDHKEDLDAIKAHIENWKSFGVVPQTRRHIEGKFNKILDALFDKLSMSKKEAELMKFSNKIEHLKESNDGRRLQNETIFIQRKIDEMKSDIFQLENNIQFISNAKADNPLIKEINKNIERQKDELNLWKDKLTQLKNISKND